LGRIFYAFPGNDPPSLLPLEPAPGCTGIAHISLDFIFETAVGFEEKLRYTPACSTENVREDQGGKYATM
jgi:hypothetical protein